MPATPDELRSGAIGRGGAPIPGGNDAPVANETSGGTTIVTVERAPEVGTADGVETTNAPVEQVAALRPAGLERAPVLADGLPDIGEASFGPGVQEIVIGNDERVRITNTSVYPWRAHAALLITARDGSRWVGTGWFIGPHTLMTAGHVVFIRSQPANPARDGWVRSIEVMPGRDDTNLPYGSVTSTNFRSVTGWTQNGDQDYDYGAIILPTDLGSRTGWLGFGVYDNATLLASLANVTGYPGVPVPHGAPYGTQWYDAKRVGSVGPRRVSYETDTSPGQSGSAVYRIVNGSRYAFGVHAYGGNHGPRIVNDMYNNMVNWKA